jgi:hypothetical protein
MAIIHNKPASAYDQPHTMSDKPVTGVLSQTTGAKVMDEMNISVGNINKGNAKGTKSSGIAQRGHGAATKGFTSRGPMC